jgi:hypothetical protein
MHAGLKRHIAGFVMQPGAPTADVERVLSSGGTATIDNFPISDFAFLRALGVLSGASLSVA